MIETIQGEGQKRDWKIVNELRFSKLWNNTKQFNKYNQTPRKRKEATGRTIFGE